MTVIRTKRVSGETAAGQQEIGTPTDGSWADGGVSSISSSTKIVDAVDAINEQLLAIKEAWIVPTFEIESFAVSPSVYEVGYSVVTPSFTASYNRSPDTALLDDDEGNPQKDVSGTPTAFDSDETFAKTANNDSVQFTLSCTEDGDPDTADATISWRPRTYWGVDVDGLSTEADIEGLSNSALDSNRQTSFTVTAGAGEHIYYAYPTSYGEATFFVGGFEGGFTLVSSTISVTNAYGVAQNYRLYKSIQPNLGTTTVTVT